MESRDDVKNVYYYTYTFVINKKQQIIFFSKIVVIQGCVRLPYDMIAVCGQNFARKFLHKFIHTEHLGEKCVCLSLMQLEL